MRLARKQSRVMPEKEEAEEAEVDAASQDGKAKAKPKTKVRPSVSKELNDLIVVSTRAGQPGDKAILECEPPEDQESEESEPPMEKRKTLLATGPLTTLSLTPLNDDDLEEEEEEEDKESDEVVEDKPVISHKQAQSVHLLGSLERLERRVGTAPAPHLALPRTSPRLRPRTSPFLPQTARDVRERDARERDAQEREARLKETCLSQRLTFPMEKYIALLTLLFSSQWSSHAKDNLITRPPPLFFPKPLSSEEIQERRGKTPRPEWEPALAWSQLLLRMRRFVWFFPQSWVFLGLGSPVVPFYPFLGEGSPLKIDYRKNNVGYQLLLSSLLEDLVGLVRLVGRLVGWTAGCGARMLWLAVPRTPPSTACTSVASPRTPLARSFCASSCHKQERGIWVSLS